MSINTILNNQTIVNGLAAALAPDFPDTGITELNNTDNNLSINMSGREATINMADNLHINDIIYAQAVTCSSAGEISVVAINNTSVDGQAWTIYSNGTGSPYPKRLNFYNENQSKSYLTLDGNTGNVGINNVSPTSQLSVGGLQNFANNAAALAGGLHAGDFYYTNTSGDGILKVVI